MPALGVQRIGGDHVPGQVQGFQQRGELGDLVGLAVHIDLAEDGAGLVVQDRHQVRGLSVSAGAAPLSRQNRKPWRSEAEPRWIVDRGFGARPESVTLVFRVPDPEF